MFELIERRQCITGGIFYCRDNAVFSLLAFNKLLCNLTGQYSDIGNKKYRHSVVGTV